MDATQRSIVERQIVPFPQARMLAQHQQPPRCSSYFAPPATLAAQTSLFGCRSMHGRIEPHSPMVAVAKLSNSKVEEDTNSLLVVRTWVPRFHTPYTIAQWTRNCVEGNLEWIVKIIRRHHRNEQVVMLAYGDGYQTIVLLDDAINTMPDEIHMIPKIGIGVSSVPRNVKEDESGVEILQPSYSIWDHLRFQQQQQRDKADVNNILFIRTNVRVDDGAGVDGRRRVLQIKTLAPKKPLEAVRYVCCPIFEQQLNNNKNDNNFQWG
jgi:hypothetical protein